MQDLLLTCRTRSPANLQQPFHPPWTMWQSQLIGLFGTNDIGKHWFAFQMAANRQIFVLALALCKATVPQLELFLEPYRPRPDLLMWQSMTLDVALLQPATFFLGKTGEIYLWPVLLMTSVVSLWVRTLMIYALRSRLPMLAWIDDGGTLSRLQTQARACALFWRLWLPATL